MFKNKTLVGAVVAVVLAGGAFFAYQIYMLEVAHSTFENYYALRGCTELLEKTETSATCRLSDGTTITLVKINNKWYLEGDGPGVW